MKALNASELSTLERLFLCYVSLMSIFKKQILEVTGKCICKLRGCLQDYFF